MLEPTSSAWLEDAARRKNGLGFQIFLSGSMVCLSSIPLVMVMGHPMFSLAGTSLFVLGFVLAYAGWPVFCAGVEDRARLIEETENHGFSRDALNAAARRLAPRLVITILAVGLALGSMSAAMAEPIQFNLPTNLSVNGYVVQVLPDSVRMRDSYGLYTIPRSGATYYVNGAPVNPTSLAIGTPVRFRVNPFSGTVTQLQNNLMTVRGANGYLYTVPVQSLPGDVQKKTKVSVQLANGNIVRVPLNAALNMQRSQGAVILPGAPQAHGNNGKHGDDGDDHGSNADPGNGKGNGKGNGHKPH